MLRSKQHACTYFMACLCESLQEPSFSTIYRVCLQNINTRLEYLQLTGQWHKKTYIQKRTHTYHPNRYESVKIEMSSDLDRMHSQINRSIHWNHSMHFSSLLFSFYISHSLDNDHFQEEKTAYSINMKHCNENVL